MVVLRDRSNCNRQKRNHKAPLPKEITRRKSIFGSYGNSSMVMSLKRLALDPCKPGASRELNHRLYDQILNVRKAMLLTNAEFPQRKRKLQQFLEGNFKASFGLVSDKYNQKNCMKLSRGQLSAASSVSCLLNSADSTESFNQYIVQNSLNSGSLLTFEDNFRGKQVSTEVSFLDNAIDFGLNIEDSSPLIDSDESVNGSNPLSPENLTLQDPPFMDADDTVYSANSSSLDEPKQLNLRRLYIPLGPLFQAEVPDWTGPVNGIHYNGVIDLENSRWLGTRIWPMEGGRTEITMKGIGQGRPDSCSCFSPGSADCIKLHILGERLRLQSELGPAFLSWKFDEMGEVVSQSWTSKEQKTFESLVKMNLLTNGTNSWKHALKCLPSKCKKGIISYYFNVFIPRRMSLQIISSSKQVNSDDEGADDVDDSDFQKKCKARSDSVGNSKDVRNRYLRQTC